MQAMISKLTLAFIVFCSNFIDVALCQIRLDIGNNNFSCMWYVDLNFSQKLENRLG